MINKNTINIIDSIYTDAKYSKRYGLDIFLTIGIVTVLVSIISYYSFLNRLQSLRKNWDQEKCNPVNLPFVHIINPDPNKTAGQQINDNIDECLKEGVKGMANNSLKDIFKKIDVFSDIKKYFDDFVKLIQSVFIWLLNTVIYLVNLILSIIQKSFLGFTHMFLKAKDIFDKIMGILVINFFVFLQFFNMAIAFFLNMASIAAALIMIPLSITVGILGFLSFITGLMAGIYTWIASLFPPWTLWAIFIATNLWFIFSTIMISFVSATVMLILMSIVTSGLVYIQNRARQYIVPTVTQVAPDARTRIAEMTPNRHIPLDEQIRQVTQESSI